MVAPTNIKEMKLADALDVVANSMAQRDFDQAQRCCRELLEAWPQSAVVPYMQALVYQLQGQPEPAIASLRQSIAAQADFELAYINLGMILTELRQLEEAQYAYQTLLSFAPRHDIGLFNVAMVLHQQGKLKESERYWRRYIALKPASGSGYRNLGGVLLEQEQWEEALKTLEQAIALDPDHAEAYNNCGVIYARQGNRKKARAAFNKALSIHPAYAPAIKNQVLLEKAKR